jgi:hypothetical protein
MYYFKPQQLCDDAAVINDYASFCSWMKCVILAVVGRKKKGPKEMQINERKGVKPKVR